MVCPIGGIRGRIASNFDLCAVYVAYEPLFLLKMPHIGPFQGKMVPDSVHKSKFEAVRIQFLPISTGHCEPPQAARQSTGVAPMHQQGALGCSNGLPRSLTLARNPGPPRSLRERSE